MPFSVADVDYASDPDPDPLTSTTSSSCRRRHRRLRVIKFMHRNSLQNSHRERQGERVRNEEREESVGQRGRALIFHKPAPGPGPVRLSDFCPSHLMDGRQSQQPLANGQGQLHLGQLFCCCSSHCYCCCCCCCCCICCCCDSWRVRITY